VTELEDILFLEGPLPKSLVELKRLRQDYLGVAEFGDRYIAAVGIRVSDTHGNGLVGTKNVANVIENLDVRAACAGDKTIPDYNLVTENVVRRSNK
jgi:hypothetical protein